MAELRYPGIAAGDLRQVVAWRAFDPAASQAPNAYGYRAPSFIEKGRHRARVRPYTGQVAVNADQAKPLVWYEVTMRRVGSIKALDQLIVEGLTLTVQYALEWDLSGAFFTLRCTAEVLNPTPSPS